MQHAACYMEALYRLKNHISAYQSYPVEFYRDELLQHFQSSLEIAWTVIEDYLQVSCALDDSDNIHSFLQKAVSADIIQNADMWSHAVTNRNIILHSCDISISETIAKQLCNDYLPLMQTLGNRVARDITMEEYLQFSAPIMLEVLKTDSQFNFRVNNAAKRAFAEQQKKECKAREELRKETMIRQFGYYDPDFHIDPLPRYLTKGNKK